MENESAAILCASTKTPVSNSTRILSSQGPQPQKSPRGWVPAAPRAQGAGDPGSCHLQRAPRGHRGREPHVGAFCLQAVAWGQTPEAAIPHAPFPGGSGRARGRAEPCPLRGTSVTSLLLQQVTSRRCLLLAGGSDGGTLTPRTLPKAPGSQHPLVLAPRGAAAAALRDRGPSLLLPGCVSRERKQPGTLGPLFLPFNEF